MQDVKKLTYADLQKVKAEMIKHDVILLLETTEGKYAEFQYKYGLAYLEYYLPGDEHARFALEGSKLFWNWFKNCWTVHDESLLTYKRSLQETPIEMRRMIYRDLHCPKAMAEEVRPNRVILDSIKSKKVTA